MSTPFLTLWYISHDLNVVHYKSKSFVRQKWGAIQCLVYNDLRPTLQVIDDWKYVALVLDRILLWLFTFACIAGTCGIILVAPSLYDKRTPLDVLVSKIGKRELLPPPAALLQQNSVSSSQWWTVNLPGCFLSPAQHPLFCCLDTKLNIAVIKYLHNPLIATISHEVSTPAISSPSGFSFHKNKILDTSFIPFLFLLFKVDCFSFRY